jgi:hypothetical protein
MYNNHVTLKVYYCQVQGFRLTQHWTLTSTRNRMQTTNFKIRFRFTTGQRQSYILPKFKVNFVLNSLKLNIINGVGFLHPVACTRSGSGFPSNATLFWIFYLVTATCFRLMTIFRRKYSRLKMVISYNWGSFCFHLWSGSGFPSNATLFWIFYSVTATCFGLMTIFRWKYFRLKMVIS